ncbi:MAG: MmgE/PrpD family protein [Burkholderiales bacterium]
MTTLTQEIARFVAGLQADTIPAAVSEKAKVALLNAYGMALAGRDTPYAPVARKAALAMDGEQPKGATLLGDGRRTSIGGACLANAALFHGRCQEDTCGAAHFGTILIPLLTAMIEARRYPLSSLIPALVAGYEAGGVIEQAYCATTTATGFRSSAIYGTLAAAAASAKLMGLNEAQIAAALANAASFSGGVLQSFADGTNEWRYQVGMAGRNGLAAAELAKAGSVSAPLALEGKSGFIRAFANTGADVGKLSASLGQDWAVLRVTFKPFPVCAFNQTPVTAALPLREQIGNAPIAAVRVHMSPFAMNYAGMKEVGPFHSISGTLMSIPFCVATTLAHGTPTMTRMTTYNDASVNALQRRITLVGDPGLSALCAKIEVETADGRKYVREQNMTPADYAFDRNTVSKLVRGIGAEEGVPAGAFDILERFVERLPGGTIDDVIESFAAIEQRMAA